MTPSPETLIVLALAAPLAGALLIPLFRDRPNLREAVTLVTAGALLAIILGLVPRVRDGVRPALELIEVAPGLKVAFQVEPLGMLFALVASSLWIVNSVYSIGYMRAEQEPRQTGFYACFALALGSAIGVAFAGNLFTLFLFYEALTLSTYPLVTHKRGDDVMRAGRTYLLLLLGTSLLLFVPAIVTTWVVAGTLDFKPGGVLGGKASPLALGLLLGLFVFGIGKAAAMPLHFWLPTAMVAPTPVSALLHAVAVVKAGVFCIAKIALYIFGLDTLAASGASTWLIYGAAAGILLASLVALAQNDLKARLAYSTVSQLAYVVLGAAFATTTGLMGSMLHIAAHAVGKITLFFCAGAIHIATRKTQVSELDGIGRTMPYTMLAFLLGSLSIIGIPPLAGFWSKWSLGLAAFETGHLVVLGILMVSSLLNVGYLLSIVGRAFFLPPRDASGTQATAIREAPLACVAPLCVTGLACVALFFGIDFVRSLIAGALAN
jgi:multicomponent Na+:H+ antiporter subunit D